MNDYVDWLKKNKIVGITGIDTRNLTNFIRDKGAPKGTISFSKSKKLNINKWFHSVTRIRQVQHFWHVFVHVP